jgi:Fe-S-cluster containining protein
MGAGRRIDGRVLERVAEIYGWLDSQIRQDISSAGRCTACGKCCDFETSDHRLFVTTPELMYFSTKLAPQAQKEMTTGRCPYNTEGKCSVYDYRFAGCRIFCCRGDADFQSRLSESVLKQFKAICREFKLPYRYCDLPAALKSLANA